jgi:hypothetical protein
VVHARRWQGVHVHLRASACSQRSCSQSCVVDFATDVAQASASLTWDTLVRPISIVLIAAALWLLSLAQREQVGAPTD